MRSHGGVKGKGDGEVGEAVESGSINQKKKERDEDPTGLRGWGLWELGTRYFPAAPGAPAGMCQRRSCQSYQLKDW